MNHPTLATHRLAASLLAVSTALAGCASPLPTYPAVDGAESLRIIAERQSRLHTVESVGWVDLWRPGGGRVRLDAALVVEMPDNLRLRAWKLGRTVIDLTVKGDEVWILRPDDSSQNGPVEDAAHGIAQALRLLSPDYFRTASVDATRTTTRQLVARGEASGATIVGTIDRRTLTPRHYELADTSHEQAVTIDLSRHRLVEGFPWPTIVEVSGPEGRVAIRLRDVSVNIDLASGAFEIPRRAERIK